jgi:uncharacterized Zn-binding protein involved in type VI secretion
MGKPAARMGDQVTGTDVHLVITPPSPAPVPTPLPFSGAITGGCVATVLVAGSPAAVATSTVSARPPHLVPPPASFAVPPTNTGVVQGGSPTVLIGGKPAARAGDRVMTCNDPVPAPTSTVVAVCTVLIGP